MKQLFSKIISFIICFIFILIPFISFAASTVSANPSAAGSNLSSSYTSITPGNFFSSSLGANSIVEMLKKIFQITITITIILSVLMMIWGGLEKMGESIPGQKSGNDRIKAALLGLLIALTSILILTSIFGGGDSFDTPFFK